MSWVDKTVVALVALIILPFAIGHLAGCQPPPGAPVTVEQSKEQTKVMERIADALEEIAAKDCGCAR